MPGTSNDILQQALKFHQEGNLVEAEQRYLTLLKTSQENTQALFLLGSLYGQSGRLPDAIQVLKRVISKDPKHLDAHNNLALAFEFSGNIPQAIETCEHALRFSPDSAVLHNNLGDLYQKCSNHQKAEQHLSKALQLKPDYEAAMINLAIVYCHNETFDKSEALFKQALNINPNNAKTYCNYSALSQSRKNYVQAESFARKALELQPNYPQAISNLGNALLRQDKHEEAEHCFSQAIKLKPDYLEAYNNLGFLYHNTTRFHDALNIYDKAVNIDPNNHDNYWYRSFTHFQLGNFKQAWADYEHGLKNGGRDSRAFPFPLWKHETDQDKTLLVYAEQGIGDQIMFASCLADLLQTRKKVILECERRLQPLFTRSFPKVRVIGTKQNSDLTWLNSFPEIEHQIALGSLGKFYRNDMKDFPKVKSYLVADKDKQQKWQDRYAMLGGKLTIGISWQGGINIDHNKRSMTLESWLPILKTPDCQFVNLQYGQHETELDMLRSKHNIIIHDWPDSDSLIELDDFAAQISALDLVISVGNTNVHLAGALGVPAWCIIPLVPSWRWMADGTHSPWYSSVRLYRQKQADEWATVINEIHENLSQM